MRMSKKSTQLNELFINRLKEKRKIGKSALLFEWIHLLFEKNIEAANG